MSRKYRAEQDIHISGWECSTEIELKMVVNFTVHPGCKQTLTEPGEEPSVEVDNVQFFEVKNGKPSPEPRSMPVWMIGALTDGDGFKSWLMSEANDQRETALCDAADARRESMMEDRHGAVHEVFRPILAALYPATTSQTSEA